MRRDYILRMIEEFIQALLRIQARKGVQQWKEAASDLNAELMKLTGVNATSIAKLSENELIARLMQDGPTHVLRQKTLMLVTLLKEAGDLAMSEGRMADVRDCYLKALHLLLHALAGADLFELPEFVPKVELMRELLQSESLPARTRLMLMQHYERTGEYAKAEDELFAVLENDPTNSAVIELGVAFYHRILTQNDATLAGAGLPRPEAEQALRELCERKRARPSPAV